MKAFLLAAGLGTRLRPLTDAMPKCMLTVGERPLLGIWLDALADAGVTEVLINLHHCPQAVWSYLESTRWPMHVRTIYEHRLLGSAGTLRASASWVKDEEFFLAFNADGLTDFPVQDLITAHRKHQPDATIAVFHSPDPSSGGVAETDADGIVTSFAEKPEHPASDLVNAGMYAFSPAVLELIERKKLQDIGTHLLPQLTGRARIIPVQGYFRDIGTPESYRMVQEEWKAR
jgi:mannose-1-phosphate guanylyltransferase